MWARRRRRRHFAVRECEVKGIFARGNGRGRGDEVFDHLFILVHLIYVLPSAIHHHRTIFPGPTACSARAAPMRHAHIPHLPKTETRRSCSCGWGVAQLHVVSIRSSVLCMHIVWKLLREECLSELRLKCSQVHCFLTNVIPRERSYEVIN